MGNGGDGAVYDGSLEVRPDGTCLAQIADLPGCFGRGTGQEDALAALVAAIPGYYAWLSAHDEYTPLMHGPYTVTPREVIRLSDERLGAFFAADAAPISNEDLDWYLALLDWAYGDLAALAAQPPVSPMLDAVAQEQLRLTTRLDARPVVPAITHLPGTPADHLRQVWQASLARLRGATDEERARVWEHEGERWSLRKVLRRSVLLARAGYISVKL
jgi:predicted RNase H-like HicB family nuclease